MVDRKLNVAITRARKQFIMLGNEQLLSQNVLYSQLIDFCKGRGLPLLLSCLGIVPRHVLVYNNGLRK